MLSSRVSLASLRAALGQFTVASPSAYSQHLALLCSTRGALSTMTPSHSRSLCTVGKRDKAPSLYSITRFPYSAHSQHSRSALPVLTPSHIPGPPGRRLFAAQPGDGNDSAEDYEYAYEYEEDYEYDELDESVDAPVSSSGDGANTVGVKEGAGVMPMDLEEEEEEEEDPAAAAMAPISDEAEEEARMMAEAEAKRMEQYDLTDTDLTDADDSYGEYTDAEDVIRETDQALQDVIPSNMDEYSPETMETLIQNAERAKETALRQQELKKTAVHDTVAEVLRETGGDEEALQQAVDDPSLVEPDKIFGFENEGLGPHRHRRIDPDVPAHMQKMGLNDIREIREGSKYAIAHVKATLNNTIITFTSRTGNILGTISGGAVGYKGAAKRGDIPANEAALKLGEKIWARGFRYIDIQVKGVGIGGVPVLNQLGALGFRVLSISNVTPKPYNGTRKRKARR